MTWPHSRAVTKADDLPDDRPTFEASQVSTAVVEAVNASLEKNGDWMQVPR